ncbi:hypothetical protein RND81_14G123000 [Saponaria officinalis]|uniref:Uncharacterized protein n=1 Tax=Saponaria officinalis TaxID=3572 RepID=A0AAW1GPD8_SAPOF
MSLVGLVTAMSLPMCMCMYTEIQNLYDSSTQGFIDEQRLTFDNLQAITLNALQSANFGHLIPPRPAIPVEDPSPPPRYSSRIRRNIQQLTPIQEADPDTSSSSSTQPRATRRGRYSRG